MSVKRNYVDSHWLFFAFEGVVALLFGWFTMFTNTTNLDALVTIVGATLLGLGIVELFNILRRSHLKETWGISLLMALVELAVAFYILFTQGNTNAYHLAAIAGYTVIRGLLEIILGIKSIDDRTDKFIWVLIGMCGCIMGFVILNSGSFVESSAFVKIFGSYMMIFGIANIIYGVHNRDQAKEFAAERKEAKLASAEKTALKKVAKTTAKSAAKSTAKATAKKTTAKSAKKPATKKTAKKPAAKKTSRK